MQDNAYQPDQLVYTLQHSIYPLGQVQSELRRRGLKGAKRH
jgi:hypothetical protein